MGLKFLFIALFLLAASAGSAGCSTSCGTETGNPQCPTQATPENEGPASETPEEPESYSNDDFGVAAVYAGGWDITEVDAVGSIPASPESDCETCEAVPSSVEGIDTSNAPSTRFTDGTSTVRIFYVLLSEAPASLRVYLEQIFPARRFEVFANDSISGFTFDNEYYFLNDTLLLYIVSDLAADNDGVAQAQTILDSIRFE